MVPRLLTSKLIGNAFLIGLLTMQSSCSTEPTLESKCAIAKDQKNAAVESMYNDAAEKIRSSWVPDLGKREGVLRTVRVSIQGQQAHRDFQYELNDLAYQTCRRGANHTNR